MSLERHTNMNLSTFLRRPADTVAREKLLHAKASYEMRLHAARLGAQIQMTEPEIDNRGYDFTLILDHYNFPVQNKTAIRPGGSRNWKIRASLLQPCFADRDLVPELDGFKVGGDSGGASGGVLLHLIDTRASDEDNKLTVAYKYLDIFYIVAVAARIFTTGCFTADAAIEFLRLLRNSQQHAMLHVPEKYFLPISSPAAILAFRLHLPISNYVSCSKPSFDLSTNNQPNSVMADLWNSSIAPWVERS
jgi:hypothetical protein